MSSFIFSENKEKKWAKQEEKTILFLGDSLTEGYLVDKQFSYPSLVEKKLQEKGYKVKVVNGGLSGDTTAGGLNRYKWFLKTDFDLLFLALGSNDGLRGIKLPIIEKNLKEIIRLTKQKKIKIVLAGLNVPPNYGEKYTNDFKKLFNQIAQEEKIFYLPFLLEGVAGEIKLNHNDGIHPNEKGYEIIANRVSDYLIKNFYEKK